MDNFTLTILLGVLFFIDIYLEKRCNELQKQLNILKLQLNDQNISINF